MPWLRCNRGMTAAPRMRGASVGVWLRGTEPGAGGGIAPIQMALSSSTTTVSDFGLGVPRGGPSGFSLMGMDINVRGAPPMGTQLFLSGARRTGGRTRFWP
eukprot:gb/GFBE01028370.1/.p1 GENE.gb/GFBE01028370.1/~~gb/GFBE01028370.1/.p1  ORF type:complete len:101 (+),score=6.29 gb/GFBE01028370.1/:1-303(+)